MRPLADTFAAGSAGENRTIAPTPVARRRGDAPGRPVPGLAGPGLRPGRAMPGCAVLGPALGLALGLAASAALPWPAALAAEPAALAAEPPAPEAEPPAPEAGRATAEAGAAEAAPRAIDRGDTIRVSAYGEASVTGILSGEFRVSRAGTIAYPILGELVVAGRSEGEVGALIRQGLGRQVPLIGTPSVAVVTYAPVALIGDVRRTGLFEYRPGMTVMHVVLEAGGLLRRAETVDEALDDERALRELELRRFALAARRQRMLAEVADEPFSGAGLDPSGVAAAADVIEREERIHAARREADASQARGYRAQHGKFTQEIASLEETIALHDEEIALLRQERRAIDKLAGQGLATQSRLRDVTRELTSARRQALEFRTALFRAEQGRLAVDQKLEEIALAGRSRTQGELSETELELGLVEIRLARARAARREAGAAGASALGRGVRYTIRRGAAANGAAAAGAAWRPADETTPLRRDDLVRVEIAIDPAPEGQGPSARGAQGRDGARGGTAADPQGGTAASTRTASRQAD